VPRPRDRNGNQEATMSDAFAAIAAQIQAYLDGLYHSDAVRLARVFHPEARYVSATDIPLASLGMEAYLPMVAARPSPASRGERRRDRVVSIELAGEDAAIARVHCAIGAKYFTDLLTFVRDGGEWRIIAKVFHYDLMT
jgi:hypothetical protein